MTDTAELRQVIKDSGLKLEFIAQKLGLTRFGLQKKIENNSEFKASEILLLCEILNITSLRRREQIFFAQNVESNSTSEVNE